MSKRFEQNDGEPAKAAELIHYPSVIAFLIVQKGHDRTEFNR
ncbi:MAG: hypothetical protein ACREIC_21465 [Limisphaerales bacterium]